MITNENLRNIGGWKWTFDYSIRLAGIHVERVVGKNEKLESFELESPKLESFHLSSKVSIEVNWKVSNFSFFPSPFPTISIPIDTIQLAGEVEKSIWKNREIRKVQNDLRK